MHQQVQYEGDLWVHYGQFYVESEDGEGFIDLDVSFRGQSNGICGAAQQGRLFLVTGLHTGTVHLTVALCESEPPIDPSWEEVVECSFEHSGGPAQICEWGGERAHPLRLSATAYRVRYCAKSMLAEWELTSDEGPLQHYSLQFWPAAIQPDRVIKVSGQCANYWHSEARKGFRSDR